jgi:hypothetical protein
MPYDNTNPKELIESLLTDPEALAEIEREKRMHLEINGEVWTTEEVIADWNAATHVWYMVVQVQDGVAEYTISEAFETRGRARAEAHNWYQLSCRHGCDEGPFVMEIRKHTYARNARCVKKEGSAGCRMITMDIELMETIRMN